MKHGYMVIILFLLFVIVSGLSDMRGEWELGGIAVSRSTYTQRWHTIASDGTGGAILAWEDDRDGPGTDIYALHVDSIGNTRRLYGGIVISAIECFACPG